MADQIQNRLLKLAFIFHFLYALILSLSPVVHASYLSASYRWSHWIGLVIWAIVFIIINLQTSHTLPDRDPYLLPVAAFLIGWGLLTIWRLSPDLGLRQAIWLAASGVIFIFIIRYPHALAILRSYKYIWLISGLILTGFTFIFGTNPAGVGPRLWLGCCGIYLQPSEPLKLFLVVYLSAYLADRLPIRKNIFPLIFPTIVLTGFALLLLVIQRDLGTASIIILLYTTILYLATGRKRVLLASAIILTLSGLVGYFVIGIVRLRIDAWLDPWLDPSGRSYQIIQSLLAVANGGLLGRGPGLGSPSLVPVAHSDFIFAAIAEETGLVGTIGVIILLSFLITRGLLISINAPNLFSRLLTASLSAYLGIQSLMIIGGNLRLFPLTGITLPFVSYGGSSLITSIMTLLLLLLISNQSSDVEPVNLPTPQPYLIVGGFLLVGLVAVTIINGWWAIIRGPDLLTRTDNPRRSIADLYVPRGDILDRNNAPINITQGKIGNYSRKYLYPNLGSIVGYTQATYGQAGLEASLDPYLRGLRGNPTSLIWWNHLVYGQPPPGLNIRLSLDLRLQNITDHLLGDHTGAAVLINAKNGEVLVMASHPTFDPNKLNEEGTNLTRDSHSPLLNRATQGQYSTGILLMPFQTEKFGNDRPENDTELKGFCETLGLINQPLLYLPVPSKTHDCEMKGLRISPTQMALAVATISNAGVRPAPQIALAVDTPTEGWVILPPLSEPVRVLSPESANAMSQEYNIDNNPYWQILDNTYDKDTIISWYLAGTLPAWEGTPLTLVVLLEESNLTAAQYIGQGIIEAALGDY